MISATDAPKRMDTSTAAKREEMGWEMFGKLALFIITLPVSMLWYGFVIVQLWAWFIVPAFHLAPLTLVAAMGLDLLMTVLRGYPPTDAETKKEKDVGKLAGIALTRIAVWPTMLLVMGWLLHLVAR